MSKIASRLLVGRRTRPSSLIFCQRHNASQDYSRVAHCITTTRPTSPASSRPSPQRHRSLTKTARTMSSGPPLTTPAFTLDPKLFNQAFYTSILKLWFPDYPTPQRGGNMEQMAVWFGSGTLDDACTSLASAALASISPTHLHLPPFESAATDRDPLRQAVLLAPFFPEFGDAALKPSARDRVEAALALALLLDQFTRNVLRGDDQQGQVYAHYDRLARAVASAATSAPLDYDTQSPLLADSPFWRFWLYMPFMHGESLDDHERFRDAIADMRARATAAGYQEGLAFCDQTGGFLESHSKPIRQFGRYPWRNRFLGREFTAEERAYIDAGGDTFGVKPYGP